MPQRTVQKKGATVGEPFAIRPNTHAELPRTRAALSHRISSVFRELDISASMLDGSVWTGIEGVSPAADVVAIELVHGIEGRRTHYNRKAVESVRHDAGPVVGEHGGFHDLFVPIGKVSGSWGVLVAGPFALTRPSAADVRSRWRWMTGRNARAADPEFGRYLATTLAVLTLEGQNLGWFKRMMECLAQVLAGEGEVDRWTSEAAAMWSKLREVRGVERAWAATRELLDEGMWRAWQSPYREEALIELGVGALPQHALVCLTIPRESQIDPVEAAIQRDAFQRACVELAKRRGKLLAGRLQTHGVVFLLNEPSLAGARAELAEVRERAAALAQRQGLRLHSGASLSNAAPTLPTRYRAALSAAEHALGQGTALVFSTPETRRTSRHHLRDLRRELARSVSEDPNVLGPRFERYLESVAVHSSYGMEAMRAQLAAGLDEITAALRDTGALEERDLGELEQALERSSDAASTAHELSAAYRKCVLDMVLALKRPLEARQERSLGRALAYIDEHFAETLTLQKVARVAGFAPGYFSKLFAKTERTSFREYTLKLRVERAKHMLKATTLSAERVGQLCGFRTRNRFYVAFRRLARVAPLAYRGQELRQAKPRRAKQLVARGRKNDSLARRVER